MRVTWVHPSWRDLVIEHLSADDDARERFLRGCSVNGVLLALSVAGGRAGERRLPLLRSDRDWDALTDRLYELAPELEQAELIGLLDGVARMNRGLQRSSSAAEAQALARELLARTSSLWKSSRVPIAPAELDAWLDLAKLLSPRPDLPPIAVTWAELLPVTAPDLSDRAGLERFADWLAVAALVLGYAPERYGDLPFPGGVIDLFLNRLLTSHTELGTGETDQALSALAIIEQIPAFAGRAFHVRYQIEAWRRATGGELTDWLPPRHEDPGRRATGALDVERVLRDL